MNIYIVILDIHDAIMNIHDVKIFIFVAVWLFMMS